MNTLKTLVTLDSVRVRVRVRVRVGVRVGVLCPCRCFVSAATSAVLLVACCALALSFDLNLGCILLQPLRLEWDLTDQVNAEFSLTRMHANNVECDVRR